MEQMKYKKENIFVTKPIWFCIGYRIRYRGESWYMHAVCKISFYRKFRNKLTFILKIWNIVILFLQKNVCPEYSRRLMCKTGHREFNCLETTWEKIWNMFVKDFYQNNYSKMYDIVFKKRSYHDIYFLLWNVEINLLYGWLFI